MKPAQIVQFLVRQVELPVSLRLPVCIHGSPGIGKSGVVYTAGQITGAEVYVIPPTIESVDVGGMPRFVGEDCLYAYPSVFPPRGPGRKILFIDEIDKYLPSVQNALLGLVLTRQVHQHKLHDDVAVFSAANKSTDRSHSQRLSRALKRRFINLDYELDRKQWYQIAMERGFRTEVVAFLMFTEKNKPAEDTFYNFDYTEAEHSFASPATWEYVSKLLDADYAPEIFADACRATVGKAAATEFLSFLAVRDELPSLPEIISNPAGAPVPEGPGTLYCLSAMLATNATVNNFDQIAKYLDRIPAPFSVLTVTAAYKRDRVICNTRGYTAWAAKNIDVMM